MLYIEPKKRAAINRLKNIYSSNYKKRNNWKKELRKMWKKETYPEELNNEERNALQELRSTIGNSGLAKL